MENKIVTAKSYTLKTETGEWLGQIVLTSDGAFMSVTDYGNFSFAWRAYGDKPSDDFREFIISLNTDYFGGKMYQGITNICYGKKYQKVCDLFAEKILPVLQKVLKEEINAEKS